MIMYIMSKKNDENTQEVITDMMDSIRERGIQIPGSVSSVVITTMVLEGWSTKLNPDIRILESLKEMHLI